MWAAAQQREGGGVFGLPPAALSTPLARIKSDDDDDDDVEAEVDGSSAEDEVDSGRKDDVR